jgi:hypothetical protein
MSNSQLQKEEAQMIITIMLDHLPFLNTQYSRKTNLRLRSGMRKFPHYLVKEVVGQFYGLLFQIYKWSLSAAGSLSWLSGFHSSCILSFTG